MGLNADIPVHESMPNYYGYTVEVELLCDHADGLASSPTVLRKGLSDDYSFRLDAAEVDNLYSVYETHGGLNEVTCQVSLEESGRDSGLGLIETHTIVFLLGMQDFKIDSVDKERLLIGPWLSEYIVTLSGAPALHVLANFKQTKCAMTFIDPLG